MTRAIALQREPGGGIVLELVSCPDCGVPAEISERFSLPSTDGRVAHVVVNCAVGHYFRMAADMLIPRTPSTHAGSAVGKSSARIWPY
jgi:hypothetical protein